MITSKLSIRLLWFITPVVILPLLFLGAFTLTNVTKSTEQQAKLTVSRFVQQQQDRIFNYVGVYRSVTTLLSSSPVLSDFLQDPDESLARERIMEVFSSYGDAYPDIVSIHFIGFDGASLAHYTKIPMLQDPQYPFLSEMSGNKQQHFMVQDKSNRTQLYFVQLHQGADDETSDGYLILTLEPSVIYQAVTEFPFDNTLNLFFDDQGKILFSSDQFLHGRHLSEYEYQKIQKLADTGTLGELTLGSIDGVNRIIYVVRMSNSHYFATSVPEDLLYLSGKAISLITAIIVVISIITIPIFIFVVVRNLLLTPIEQLGEASHRVGDGDLSVQLPVDNADEIGSLFNDFNHMVNQISHYQGELEDYKEHLEEKVKNRTQALADMNTQLEKAIEQAEQASQLKSRFLANMSHEIRTPLTAIIGFTEQLMLTCKDNEESPNHKHLATILRNSRHLLELINNILDLSKVEAEKLESHNAPLGLYDLLQDIDSVLRPQAQDKGLNFEIRYQFPLPKTITSDITRLKQILLNVASNAVKFTEQGQVVIEVSYIEDKDCMKFAVADTGIGISKREMTRLFKPFEQADATTTRRFGGTGLGLCISKNLAQLLGGDVKVTSELGIGSTFTITVAANLKSEHADYYLREDELIASKTQTNPLNEISFDATVLVAEDNADNRALLKLLLETWGITADFAKNGAEAVEKALLNDYQLILMDMQMPVMGGLEATEMLRNAAYDGPIIALTANVMKHDVDTYLEAGCDRALAKPIDKDELEHTLYTYLKVQKDEQNKWDNLLKSERFVQLNETYKAKLPEYLEELNVFYQTRDWEQLQALAHSLKGSAGCFGFSSIQEAAGELEAALRAGNAHNDHYLLLKLETAIKFVLETEGEPHE